MTICCASNKCGSVLSFVLCLIVCAACSYSVYELYRRDEGRFTESLDAFTESLSNDPYYALQFLLVLIFAVLALSLAIILLIGIVKRRSRYLLVWSLFWLLVIFWFAAYIALQIYELYRIYGPKQSKKPEGQDWWMAVGHVAGSFLLLLLEVWAFLAVCGYRKELLEGRHEEYQQVSTN